jgi:hypothetical protein
MTKKIVIEEYETKPGRCIACALVGNEEDVYEIYVDGDDVQPVTLANYYVNGLQVPHDVYMACMATSDCDRYDPNDDRAQAHKVEVLVQQASKAKKGSTDPDDDGSS